MMPAKGRIPLHDYSAQRIVLIKPRALGDIIHSFPVLAALRHRYASAHITAASEEGLGYAEDTACYAPTERDLNRCHRGNPERATIRRRPV
jgi:hypothetical protein